MKKFVEGEVQLYAPDKKIPTKKMEVFYNPEKKECRDISLSFIRACKWKNKPRVCDLLAATGVRGLRMEKECSVGEVHINDANPLAYKAMKRNIKLTKSKAIASNMNAFEFLGKYGKFDYIDVDPFGSPNPFLSAMLNVRNGGILAVCATDTAALSGTYPKVTRRRYGSRVIMTNFHNEVGLRILIKHIVEYGASIDLACEPVFSHSTRHYLRAYFKVESGAGKIDRLLRNNRYLKYDQKTLKREVGDAGNIGPLWCGPLYDKKVVTKMDYLPVHLKEEIDVVGYYLIPKVYRQLKSPVAKTDKIVQALKQKDIPVSRTHFAPQGLKIDADIEKVKRVLKRISL
jgi:tRNA (guanine26-N2/guanine27-N2)-dimethyltransferase